MNNLAEFAEDIDTRVKQHPLVRSWKIVPANGTAFSDSWMRLDVDPSSVLYSTRDLSLGVGISTNKAQARVNIVWPYRSWKGGITDMHLTYALERAIGLVEYLWNNHFFTPENGYVNTVITMEV